MGRLKWLASGIALILLLTVAARLRSDWLDRTIYANERTAGEMLKTLSTAERNFSKNDRDGNGVQDYWTGDVAGLLQFGLIPRAVAEADARPIRPLVPSPIPYCGYYFVAMVLDQSVTPPDVLAQDTDQKSGKVHHRTRFALCAYPADPGVTGNLIIIMNQDLGSPLSRRTGPVPSSWPPDSDMITWNRCWGGG